MSIYVDTSVLVAALTKEGSTARMQSWMTRQPPGTLVASEWVATEFAAAVSTKVRMGVMLYGERAEARAGLQQLWLRVFAFVPITEAHFKRAALFADQHALGLRASDALHLAIAATPGTKMATLDQKLARAALALGFEVEPL